MLKVKLLSPSAKAPSVAHPGEDLGYDLFASEDATLFNQPTWVSTGIAVEDTEGHGFIVKDRSSMAAKGVLTHGGVIDPGYRGEIKVCMSTAPCRKNCGYIVKRGDKVAQMVPVMPATSTVEVVSDLSDTERGTNGFGSSGTT